MTDIYQFGLRKTGSLHRLGSGHYLRKIEFVWTCPGAVKTLARVNYQEAWNVPEIADKTDGQVPQVTLDISFHVTTPPIFCPAILISNHILFIIMT